jgi:potassium-transporting ATPase potassium-binding subunit
MTSLGILQIVIYFLLILVLTKPVGIFMARLFEGERTFLHPVVRPFERLIYKLCGVEEKAEQRWTQYAGSLLAFSAVSFIFAYIIQRVQAYLPLNPQNFGTPVMTPDLAFNTAASFITNTNWQSYSGESTMSYFVQMAVLTVQNFVSAAAGVACAIAVIRGFSRQQASSIGNFWVDLTRAVLYIFLPVSIVFALFLCSQGVIQNFDSYKTIKTLEGAAQTIPMGPFASQEAIKMVGTNGGGPFNANSAHPFENPTPLTNFVQMLSIFLIPAGLTYTFGRMVKDSRQGWAIFAAFSIMFLAGVFITYPAEQSGNPILTKMGIQNAPTGTQSGGNMEGKETRFGIAASSLFAVVTTDASCGAVNNMHESLTPIAALVPIFNMETGEVIFGGTGAGMYGILLYAILAVFIAGLMVGRTPEYIGKKIEQKEVKMAMLALIATAASVLIFTGFSLIIDPKAGLNASGPHGFQEILYAYTSATGNNGSAFAGLNANGPWYNTTIGLACLIGRFLFLLPLLAAAGSLASKKRIASTSGTFPTHGPLFIGLLVGTVIIVGALTYFPALSLGPIVEHFLMNSGKLFS